MGTALIPYPGNPEPRKPKPRFTEEIIAEGLRRSQGIVSDAAKIIGCSRRTVTEALRNSAYLREVRDHSIGVVFDMSVKGIAKRALLGDPNDQRFFVRTWGPQHGLIPVQRTEVSGPDGGPVQYVAEGELTDEQIASLSDDDLRAVIRVGQLKRELRERRGTERVESGAGAPQAGV